VTIDFGEAKKINTIKVYVLDDGRDIVPPAKIALESWNGDGWITIDGAKMRPERPTGRRHNTFEFPEQAISRFRVVLTHAKNGKSGLTEIEAWGDPPK
jgi:hypothetical protein